MKGSGKLISLIAVFTSLVLLYVHGEISLLRLSYSLHEHNREMSHKKEEYRFLRFEVDQLKAPRLLEERMQRLKLDLTLPKEVRLVKLPVGALSHPFPEAVAPLQSQDFTGRLGSLFGRMIGVAQAKTEDKIS